MIVPIDDPEDPRLEPYRAVRERDLVGREGRFIAEGRVVLEKALQAMPDHIESVLVSAQRHPGLSELLSAVPPGVPVYVASQQVMDGVVGFPIHRGLLAVGRRPVRDARALLAGAADSALVVGLVGIANHDNMGGILRNAAAFGVDGVLLDETCCDPLYRKAIRVSVGGALTTPWAQAGDAESLVSLLTAAGFDVLALTPGGEVDLTEIRPAGRLAVLFGAEGPGLPADVLAQARGVRIAMAGGFDSLNVATTSGIVLHSLAAGRRARP